MIEEINEQLDKLLNEIVDCEDKHAIKIAEHIQRINALHSAGDIDNDEHVELLEDAKQIIEVEKEAAALEAKIKLEEASRVIERLIELVI